MKIPHIFSSFFETFREAVTPYPPPPPGAAPVYGMYGKKGLRILKGTHFQGHLKKGSLGHPGHYIVHALLKNSKTRG